jgi:hypothetical protein
VNFEQEIDEWNRDLFASLVSLRVFTAIFYRRYHGEYTLSFIRKVLDGAPNLQYCSMMHNYGNHLYWKQVGGEWIHCDETEFPS